MSMAAYEAVFDLLFQLSCEHAEVGNETATTGWMLVEANFLPSGEAVPSGDTSLEGLHDELLTADPTNREGRDLFT